MNWYRGFIFLNIVGLLSGCTTGPIDISGIFSNQGVVGAGDNTGNTMTTVIDYEKMDIAGNRILTQEDKEKAKAGFDKGAELVHRNKQTILNLFRGHRQYYVKKDTASPDITIEKMVEKFKKLKPAHKDLKYLITEMYRIHGTFIIGEVARTKARAKR